MISIKEREDMAKDKLKIVKNLFDKALVFVKNFPKNLPRYIEEFKSYDNLKQRIISSIVLIIFAVYAIFYSKNLFIFFALAITIIMVEEWLSMMKNMPDQNKWRLIGFFYILIPIYSVIQIRMYDSDILFWMFSVIWATDIFAYFAGKNLGGAKLAPHISPNKTWAGLFGGVFASVIIGFLSSFMFKGGIVFFVFISAFLSVVEQASDLLESKFKRIFGVKDSGNLIPGHGGVLDRLDGMMLVAPVVLILINLFSSKFGG